MCIRVCIKQLIAKSESKVDQLQSSFSFVVSTGSYELFAINRWITSVGDRPPYILMLRRRNRVPVIFLPLSAKRNFPHQSIHPFAPYYAIRSPPTKHEYGRLSEILGGVSMHNSYITKNNQREYFVGNRDLPFTCYFHYKGTEKGVNA